MFCALLTSRYQVSVYRTNGPLVTFYSTQHGQINSKQLIKTYGVSLVYNSRILSNVVVQNKKNSFFLK